jgi:hypothetical protein
MGILYAKVNGQWVRVSTGGGRGIEWPIQTVDSPLDRGDSIAEQNLAIRALIQIDRNPDSTDTKWLAGFIQFHPLTEFGPLWAGLSHRLPPHGPGGSSIYLKDVNPYETYASIGAGDERGRIDITAAEMWDYFSSIEHDIKPIPTNTIINEDNAYLYNMDAWTFWGGMGVAGTAIIANSERAVTRHWSDDGSEPTSWDDLDYGGARANLWLGNWYGEIYVDSHAGSYPDYQSMTGLLSTSQLRDKSDLHSPSAFTTIWTRHQSPEVEAAGQGLYETFHFRVDSRGIRIYDGPMYNEGSLPDSELARGTLSVLHAVSDVQGTDRDPTIHQWFRQIGNNIVTFTDGIGSYTPLEKMGPHRHVQASVVGTTVGGPMIAQVNSTDTTIDFYLTTTHTGPLAVSWSVDYAEPQWLYGASTKPVVGYVYVGYQFENGPHYDFFLQDDWMTIPALPPTHDVVIKLHGNNFDPGIVVCDQTGTPRGTVTDVTIGTGGQDKAYWTVSSDWYPIGEGTFFYARNPNGQISNIWKATWGDVEMPNRGQDEEAFTVLSDEAMAAAGAVDDVITRQPRPPRRPGQPRDTQEWLPPSRRL